MLRLIAVLLIPCLVIDPVAAVSFEIDLPHPQRRSYTTRMLLNEQAISVPDPEFLRPFSTFSRVILITSLWAMPVYAAAQTPYAQPLTDRAPSESYGMGHFVLFAIAAGAGIWGLYRSWTWMKTWPWLRRRYELKQFYRHRALEVLQDYSTRVAVAWKLYELTEEGESAENGVRLDFSSELPQALLDARNFHINYPQSTPLRLEEKFNDLKRTYPKLPRDEFPILRLGLGLDWPVTEDKPRPTGKMRIQTSA